MNDIKISRYRDIDLLKVATIWERATKIGHPFLSAEFVNVERQNLPTAYLPDGDVWVCAINQVIVGFMILHADEVGGLFVEPTFHRKGIGAALIRHAKEIHRGLDVEVFEDNVSARQFYSKLGFKFAYRYLHKQSGMVMQRLKYQSN